MMRITRTRLTLLVLLALAVLRSPVSLAMQMLLPDAAVAPVTNYIALMVQSLLLFALPGWLLRSERPGRPERKAALSGWGLLPLTVAVLARGVATPLNRWWTDLLHTPVSALQAADDTLELATMVLAVAVIPAVAEEIFFRGALLANLQQSGSRMQALLLTTVMFALMHGNQSGLPGHLIISLSLSALMLHSGRLAEPIAAHMLFNLLALAGWELTGVLPWMCGLLLCGLIGWMLASSRKMAEVRLPALECLLCAAILLVMGVQYLL